MGRVFHLTKFGNAIVANNIIQAMVTEQAKMMNQPADPTVIDPNSCPASGTTSDPPPVTSTPAPAPVAPYVTTGGSGATAGKCHVHVNEFQDCASDAHNLLTEVTIWDVGGNQIGYQDVKEAGASDPLSVNSKLEAPLVVTPEHKGNYVQFSLGTEQFDTRQADQTALSWCSTGGWDPKEGPACGRYQQNSVSDSSLLGLTVVAGLNVLTSDRNDKWTVTSSVHITEASRRTDRERWAFDEA